MFRGSMMYDNFGQEDKLLNDIWLDQISGIPSQIKGELVRRFGGSGKVREAGAEEICRALTGQSLGKHPRGELWKKNFDRAAGKAESQLADMEKRGIKAAAADDPIYPEKLRHISDPPWLLYFKGDPVCLTKRGISVVGARNSTEYGRWAAYEIGRTLAEAGLLVVSGMAGGIDAVAHKGALDGAEQGECATLAVFGCGVDICYPKSNQALMEQIISHGAVISEYPPGTSPKAWHFPRRNRIISGITSGVVVVEAGLKSGSLITAGLAAEQGRDVYAVPGNINRFASKGTNQLIRDGAVPLTCPNDLLLEIGIVSQKNKKSMQDLLGEDEKRLYNEIFQCGEITMAELARRLEMPVEKAAALVTILELKGILHTALGKIFIAKS